MQCVPAACQASAASVRPPQPAPARGAASHISSSSRSHSLCDCGPAAPLTSRGCRASCAAACAAVSAASGAVPAAASRVAARGSSGARCSDALHQPRRTAGPLCIQLGRLRWQPAAAVWCGCSAAAGSATWGWGCAPGRSEQHRLGRHRSLPARTPRTATSASTLTSTCTRQLVTPSCSNPRAPTGASACAARSARSRGPAAAASPPSSGVPCGQRSAVQCAT